MLRQLRRLERSLGVVAALCTCWAAGDLSHAGEGRQETPDAGTVEGAESPSAKAVTPPPSPFPLEHYDSGTGDLWESLWSRSHLTGNWDYAAVTRNQLAEAGITFKLQATQVAQMITRGGTSTNNGLQYSGSADYLLYLDTTRFTKGLWPGGMWTVHAETQWGRSVNGKVGSLSPVNFDALFPLPDDPGLTTLSELHLTQFFSPKFGVLVGKVNPVSLADSNAFANNEHTQFLNTALRNNPVLLPFAPYTLLATALFYFPTDWLHISAFAVDTNGTVTRTGFDSNGWFHNPRGTTLGTEWQLLIKPFGLPGTQRVALGYSNKKFTDLNLDPRFDGAEFVGFEERPDDWLFYYNFDQYLYTDPKDDKQGFGVFGRFGYSTGHSNPIERFYSAGLGGQGLIPNRAHDRYGVGYYYIDISDDLPDVLDIGDEQGVEVFYNAAVTPWFTLSPDVQYIIQPGGGFGNRRNAFVVGVRAQIEL